MKILLISAIHAPFIQDDIDVLKKHFAVQKQIGHGLIAIIKIFFRVFSTDVVFCWFASTYAFVAVAVANMLGLKSIVIVGGVDAAKDKELNYGIWLSPWKSRLVRYVFRNATRILVVDPFLKEQAIKLAEYDGKNISYLPTGYDSHFWKPLGVKESIVLTVAAVRDAVTFKRKGIDTLIEAAKTLPNVRFIIVGTDPELALKLRPPLNMEFYGVIPRIDILPFYQRAKIYCQPSRWEGLPNALCEAMLCGCIPVATEVCGNPTAVSNTGILVPSNDSAALVAALQSALNMNEDNGAKARARIVSLFPKERRENELVRLIRGNEK
jgi:glycosyltransferase involved in cell wall biosynthesis